MSFYDPAEMVEGLKRVGFAEDVKEVDQNERTVVAYASTKTIDSYDEVLIPDGADLTRFQKNPVVPWAHDYHIPPVAKALWIKNDGKGLLFKAKFASTAFASDVWKLYSEGYLRAFSVGYDEQAVIRKDDGETYKEALTQFEIDGEPRAIVTKWRLWEVSAVPLPANEDALVAAIKSGTVKSKSLIEYFKQANVIQIVLDESKGVTPYADLPTAPEDRTWDAAAARARVAKWASSDGSGDKDTIDWAKYRKAFFWYDSSAPDNFGSYKLPFADVVDGKLMAVWRGVAASMAALLGARGGVDIPEKDRKPVYNHIVKYYKKFDKEPPDFKELDSNLDIVAALQGLDARMEELAAAVNEMQLKTADLWDEIVAQRMQKQTEEIEKQAAIDLREAQKLIEERLPELMRSVMAQMIRQNN